MTDTISDEQADWFGPDVATFGDRLAGAREAIGLTQAQFAKRLGVRLSTVQGWEEDLLDPRANRLQMMAGMLNVSIRWLLTGEGEGVEAPLSDVVLSENAQASLAEIARLRAQMQMLLQQMGQVEKRLRHLLRSPAPERPSRDE